MSITNSDDWERPSILAQQTPMFVWSTDRSYKGAVLASNLADPLQRRFGVGQLVPCFVDVDEFFVYPFATRARCAR